MSPRVSHDPNNSTTFQPPKLKICHFENPLIPIQPYFCFENETCCKEGCCIKHNFKFFRSWYFWLALILIFIIYRYFFWLCKKSVTRNTTTLTNPNVPRNEDNVHIVNLMVSYNNRRGKNVDEEPPPVYNVAINLPRPETSYEEVVPTYEEAISMK